MTISLDIVNPLEYPEWDELLAKNPSSSFFHTSNWARVLVETYNYKPLYFCTIRGELSSLIPTMEVQSLITGKRGVSLPFTDYSAPILDKDSDAQHAIDRVIQYGKNAGWDYLEIRGGPFFPEEIPSFTTYYGHTLELSSDENAVFSLFRDSTVRNIKKAVKEGVIVRRSESMDDVNEFYRLNCITRREHGLPPQPRDFFRRIYQQVISLGKGFIVLAEYNDRCIAACVYFHFNGKALYKYGASDKKYQHLRANNLVMWEAIKWYCRNGHRNFCFGRTEPENKGLRQFKSGWGATEHVIRYYRYDLKKDKYLRRDLKKSNFAERFFRGLPIPMLRITGEMFYRHMG